MRIAVLGMGVIGKRLVDAVTAHPGLELVAVGVRGVNGAVLARPDLAYFVTEPDRAGKLDAAGIAVHGSWDEGVKRADLVFDAGPSRTGVRRAALYAAAGVAVRYCGGERDRALGPLLHRSLNREVGFGLRSARLASCNTTALGRVVAALGREAIVRAHATVIKCATDTDKAGKGVTSGAVFDARQSHHAADLREIVPGLALTSHAVTVPMVCGHVVLLHVETRPADTGPAAGRLGRAPGITVLVPDQPHDSAVIRAVSVGDPSRSSSRGDRYDVAVQISRMGNRLSLALSLDNEAITIPEAIDAILAFGEGSY